MGPPPPGDATAFARWQGEIDEFRRGVNGRFTKVDERYDHLDQRQDDLDKELSSMRAKVAAGAAIGSVVGGGIVTIIVAIGSKALGG